MNLSPEALAQTSAQMHKAREIAADLSTHTTATAHCILELADCMLLLKSFNGDTARTLAYLEDARMVTPLLIMAAKLETPSK